MVGVVSEGVIGDGPEALHPSVQVSIVSNTRRRAVMVLPRNVEQLVS
jgi:hypothetical protein